MAVNLEDGVYIVCPRCKKISDGSDWMVITYTRTRYRVKGKWELEEISWQKPLVAEIKHVCGFKSTGSLQDFAIQVRDGKVVAIGDYWDNPAGISELEQILGGI